MIPLESVSDGWDRDLPLMVIPLSIEEAYDCFWDDRAPFLVPNMRHREHQYLVNWTLWTEPNEKDKERFGDNVEAVRKFERRIPSSHTERMYSAPIEIVNLGLMDQTDTGFTVMVRQSYVGSPYALAHQTWFKYEFITDSVDSKKTAIR